METSILLTHLAFGGLWGMALHVLQQWKAVPWINQNSMKLNVAIRAVLALLTGLGIHGAYVGSAGTGWQISIAIPSLAVLGHQLTQVLGQYFVQQGWLTAFQAQQFIVAQGKDQQLNK